MHQNNSNQTQVPHPREEGPVLTTATDPPTSDIAANDCVTVSPHVNYVDRLLRESTILRAKDVSVFPVRKDEEPFSGSPFPRYSEKPMRPHRLRSIVSVFTDACLAAIPGRTFAVISIDEAYIEKVNPYLDALMTPTARAGNGARHYYVQAGLRPNTGIRIDGVRVGEFKAGFNSYVIVPPSISKVGAYEWLPGRSFEDVPVAPVPESFADFIRPTIRWCS